MLLTLSILALVVTGFVFSRIPRPWRWARADTYFLLHIALHYPMRGMALALGWPSISQVSERSLLIALCYVIAFVLVFGAANSILGRTPNRPLAADRRASSRPTHTLVAYAGVVLHFAFFAYLWETGYIRVFAYYARESAPSELEKAIWMFSSARWFFLSYALLAPRLTKKTLVAVGIMLLLTAVQAAMAAVKGELVMAVVAIMAARTMAIGSVPRKVSLLLATAALGAGFWSYVLRVQGRIWEPFVTESWRASFPGQVQAAEWQVAMAATVDRFAYLDLLALVVEYGPVVPRGAYAAGSLVEVVDLIPRALVPDRPSYSFNTYITQSILGMPIRSETPIGRIGESYFAFGWAGIVMASLYAALFHRLGDLGRRARGAFGQALYLYVLLLYGFPDGHLMLSVKTLVYVVPVLCLGRVIFARTLRRIGTAEGWRTARRFATAAPLGPRHPCRGH